MANEKRLIDADALKMTMYALVEYLSNENIFIDVIIDAIDNYEPIDAVPTEQLNALKSLVNGEWVDCKLVQEALGIDFATGLKMFEFSRTAEWNHPPLNGQKITTKFRLKNAVEVVHGEWIDESWGDWRCSSCHHLYTFDDYGDVHPLADCGYNYCPNCGADMR